jgi:hypothetical protein
VVESSALLKRRTSKGYRGFESLPHRCPRITANLEQSKNVSKNSNADNVDNGSPIYFSAVFFLQPAECTPTVPIAQKFSECAYRKFNGPYCTKISECAYQFGQSALSQSPDPPPRGANFQASGLNHRKPVKSFPTVADLPLVTLPNE